MIHLALPCLLAAMTSADATPKDTLILDVLASRSRDSLIVHRGKVVGSVYKSGVVDSNTHFVFQNGGMEIPSYTPPTGPWYAVATLRMDAYGDQSSWHISNFLATATWPDGFSNPPIQGFQFRTGGSGLYPAMPRDPKVSDLDYKNSLDVLDREMQAQVSRCLLGFSQASTDPNSNWIQSNSDRCLPLGEWVHFAAGWDGTRQRLFLNGLEVTDTLRQLGKGLQPRANPGVPLTVGMRGSSVMDQFQFFHGALQSARIHAGILDSAKAVDIYHADNPVLSGTCKASVSIVLPCVAAAVFKTDSVTLKLKPSASCRKGMVADLVFRDGDSIDVVAISLDESRRTVGSARVGSLSFPLSVLGIPDAKATPFVLKSRLVRAPLVAVPYAARSMAEADPSSDMERPMVLIARSSATQPRAPSGSAVWVSSRVLRLPEGARPVAVRADGTTLELADQLEPGVWDLSALPRGIWWIKAGSSTVVFSRF